MLREKWYFIKSIANKRNKVYLLVTIIMIYCWKHTNNHNFHRQFFHHLPDNTLFLSFMKRKFPSRKFPLKLMIGCLSALDNQNFILLISDNSTGYIYHSFKRSS